MGVGIVPRAPPCGTTLDAVRPLMRAAGKACDQPPRPKSEALLVSLF